MSSKFTFIFSRSSLAAWPSPFPLSPLLLSALLICSLAVWPLLADSEAPDGSSPWTFTYRSDHPLKSVSLIGDFNQWNPTAAPMAGDGAGQVWHLEVPLSFGRHSYKFVLDNTQFINDPAAGTQPDGKGNTNSLITVGPENPFHAPLYWTPYEYNFKADSKIPEKEWEANVDWVEKNLLPFGYDMVCIDGWGDEVYNQDGYRSSHAKEWKHDYAWWSQNLQSRGMRLGIYNNPLWIIKAAANAGVKVKGTDIPIKSLMDESEKARFTWVQVDRPGAEEYVKNYVRYYAEMGVKYLRIDFLSWYETGHDLYEGRVGPRHTRAQYEKGLRWIREACDEQGMFLSLVMPNLLDEAELEVRYGHMFRIDEDCSEGNWGKFNDKRRGVRVGEWSQYATAFDGLTYWASLSGRHHVILDADFLRINQFANDEERKTAVSLCIMAGAPVAVADQYSTIGDHVWVYQNAELLALNRDGFVGQPLTTDPTKEQSQVWVGSMSNGDRVIGLFNRESTAQNRECDFKLLGITNPIHVRDLWAHHDLGELASIRSQIPPHGCQILLLSQ